MAIPSLAGNAPTDLAASDWPQWRGPNRDGMVLAGPRLADAFSPKGPKLLWKTKYGDAMQAKNGGSCTPVVSGGRVILYLNPRPLTPKKLITSEYLARWGWNADLPADVAKLLEDERKKHEYDKGLYGKDADPEAMPKVVKAFSARLDPTVAEKFKATIENRLGFQYTSGWDWGTLEAMYRNIDTEFKSRSDFEVLYQTAPMHHNGILGAEVEFFMKQLEEQSHDIVVCLNAQTGKEIWKKDFPGLPGRSETMNSWPASATPCILGGRIYLVGSAAVYCLSLQTGDSIWKSKPMTRCENSSPMVVDDKVCVVLESGLTCFDAQTGAELWKNNAMGGRYDWGNTVMPWTEEGTTYVIGGNGKCVNLATGKTTWTAPKMTQSCVSPAISGDSAVFFGEKLQMYQLSPTAAVQSWAIAGRSGDRVSGPIIYRDAVYTTAMGGTRCVDRKSGQIRWEEPQLRTMFSTPIFIDGVIVAAADDDHDHGLDTYWPIVFCYKATPEKFEQVFRMPLDSALAYCSSPAIADGRMYLHQLDCVACYDLAGK